MGRCFNSTVIDAPCDEVWKTIRNFHDLAWARPVISSVAVIGEVPGDRVGAKRLLNGAFEETLLSVDDDERCFSYSIDDGPEPVDKGSVSNYVGTVRLQPVTDTDSTFVQWEASYDSPSEGAVTEFCNPIYVALLAAMKEHFSG
jgi:uncharacterized membrane protein